jgi:tetratricopeptide (TPR) repeat protein
VLLLAALVALLALYGVTRVLLGRRPQDDPRQAAALLQQGAERRFQGDLHGAAELLKRATVSAPDWAEAHRQLGILYYEAREYDLSRTELRRAVELDPNDAAGWGQLGKLFLTTGALDEAETALRRAMQLRPERATYVAMLGEVYRQRGDPASATKAIEIFRHALTLDPRSGDAYHRLGLLYQRLGRFAEAGVALRAATRFEPHLVEPYYALAQVERKLGNTTAADRAMARFRRLEAEKRAEQTRRERSGPTNDQRPTTNETESGVPTRPTAGDPSATLAPRNDADVRVGRSSLVVGRPSPQAAALLARGQRAFYGESQPDQALTLFEQARQIDPDSPDAHYQIGLVLHFMGRLDEAETAFRQALARNPHNPRYHAWIGTIQLERGPTELDAAVASLRRSVELGPDYAYGHYQLGRAYLMQNRPADALPVLERAVKRNPRYREAFYSLGQAYLRLGKREAGQRALATFRRLDAFERERRRLSLLARAAPNDPAPRLRLIRYLAANGERAAALRMLDGLLRTHPDNREAQAELQRLRSGSFNTETRRHGEERTESDNE